MDKTTMHPGPTYKVEGISKAPRISGGSHPLDAFWVQDVRLQSFTDTNIIFGGHESHLVFRLTAQKVAHCRSRPPLSPHLLPFQKMPGAVTPIGPLLDSGITGLAAPFQHLTIQQVGH